MTIHSDLADRYAAVKIEIEALEAELNSLKREINDTGAAELEGTRFKIVVNLQERTTVSAKEAQKILPYAKLAKTSCFPTIRYKAIAG